MQEVALILNDRSEGKEIACPLACSALCAHCLESLPGEKGSSLTGRAKADVSRAG